MTLTFGTWMNSLKRGPDKVGGAIGRRG
jgi:hypothetical protein